jgi:hypothetical protein
MLLTVTSNVIHASYIEMEGRCHSRTCSNGMGENFNFNDYFGEYFRKI